MVMWTERTIMINRTRKLRQDVQRLLREDYPQRKAQLETLPLRIETERSRLTAIRSASAESTMISGGGNVRQERDTSIIVEIDRLSAELKTAKLELKTIDRIFEELSTEQLRTVELMDLSRQNGALNRLCEELHCEKSKVYDIYNTALDTIARLYFGQKS